MNSKSLWALNTGDNNYPIYPVYRINILKYRSIYPKWADMTHQSKIKIRFLSEPFLNIHPHGNQHSGLTANSQTSSQIPSGEEAPKSHMEEPWHSKFLSPVVPDIPVQEPDIWAKKLVGDYKCVREPRLSHLNPSTTKTIQNIRVVASLCVWGWYLIECLGLI